MKKHLILFGFIIIPGMFLNSCEESKKIRYYNLDIELSEPIPNIREADPLPDYLKVFANYTDTSCSHELFVPEVTFVRTDIKSANSAKLEPPLTWINKRRKGIKMLPSEYLKEDYNNLINKLVTPKILTEAKGKIKDPTTGTTGYGNNTFSLNVYKVEPDSVKALKDKITRKLSGTKGNITIRMKIVNTPVDQGDTPIRPNDRDTAENQDSLEQKANAVIIDDKENRQSITKPEREPEPKPVRVPDPKIITANSLKLEEYFQKIGDQSVLYDLKENLKAGIIEKYFAGENSLVVTIGINGTEVAHQKVKDFIEDLSQRNFDFKVLDKETDDSQKITTLKIKEL
ncbi:MAG: hypothetical protein ABFD10_08020 [Prolixibacteraceae bacterium]